MLWINKYAKLLAEYALFLKEGDLVFLRSTVLAHDLVAAFAKECVHRGAFLVVDLDYEDQEEYLKSYGNQKQMDFFPEYKIDLMRKCDAYLLIRAPFQATQKYNIAEENEKRRQQSLTKFQEIYFERLGNGSLKRTLCQYPTEFSANQAGMSLSEYRDFVIKACYLDQEDPERNWKNLSEFQAKIVDYLDNVKHVVYEHHNWRIEFDVQGRKWINSDGKSNMPSGEVFTSPIENSVNGNIFFSYPSTIFGEDVEGIQLVVQDGYIISYQADKGQDILDKVFATEGARYFGEVAIGTNSNIQKATKNILFDEKIGGTIHMAVGQSYYQCGGKNKSVIHWDLITDMKRGGRILADGKLIYENGIFLI